MSQATGAHGGCGLHPAGYADAAGALPSLRAIGPAGAGGGL